jgi:hypothetical protein
MVSVSTSAFAVYCFPNALTIPFRDVPVILIQSKLHNAHEHT